MDNPMLAQGHPLTCARPRVVMPRTMPAARRPLPFRVELSADDFHALLKHARTQSAVSRRLVAAEDSRTTGSYVITGYGDGRAWTSCVGACACPQGSRFYRSGVESRQEGLGGHSHVYLRSGKS